jgi:hypothetical protein
VNEKPILGSALAIAWPWGSRISALSITWMITFTVEPGWAVILKSYTNLIQFESRFVFNLL